jgi:GDP-4-dehydro-6-deoxy-D-mannose reductase
VKRKNRVVVTGVAGFAGSHLAERLLSSGYEIYGLLAPDEKPENISRLINKIKLDRIDILNGQRIYNYIKGIGPEYIIHMAAMASVGVSLRKERLTYEINFLGSINVMEAALSLGDGLKKLILISSADCYGTFKPEGKLLKENQPFNPVSPYGISKAAMEYVAQYYFRQYRLPIVIARSFNHTGPRQAELFVVASFCKQIAEMEAGLCPPRIAVGNLSAKRDLSDVRDIAEGYLLMLRRGKAGEVYHLSSGRAVSIKDILEMLLAMSELKIKVVIDKNKMRKSDIPILRGDNSKAQKELGWHRRYDLSATLKDTLEYWRKKYIKK